MKTRGREARREEGGEEGEGRGKAGPPNCLALVVVCRMYQINLDIVWVHKFHRQTDETDGMALAIVNVTS